MAAISTWEAIEPDSYYKSFLSRGIRPDGRDWRTARPLTVKVAAVNTAEGSATVRLGNTTVVCGIKAELACPSLQKPNHGYALPNVELHPCCSPKIKAGPPGRQAISASQLLNALLQAGHLLDHTELCVIPDKVVWCLYCDLVCLDYDGNLCDASVLALVAALTNLALPTVRYDEDTNTTALDRATKPLQLKGRPLCTTFGIYDSDIQLLDPSAADESQCAGETSVVLLEDGRLAYSRKTGGRQVSSEKMEEFVKVATGRLPLLQKALQQATHETPS